MISLSTAWNPKQLRSVAKQIAAGRRLGFRAFEIGMSVFSLDLEAVMKEVERHALAISSVHALCSAREEPPPLDWGGWIAEPDEARRQEGVALTKETIDIARRVGAGAVVIHGGTLPMPDGPALQGELYRSASPGAREGRHPMLDAFIEQRKRIAPSYLRTLETSLKELCEYASGMVLALENRYYISELPHNEEFQLLFDRVGAPNLRYWHDTGHAQILDRLGFVSQVGLLEQYGGRLAGMHLHDIKGFEDHQPPGAGDFNFGAVAEHLRPGVARVMEISSRFPGKAVRRGKEHLAEVYGIE